MSEIVLRENKLLEFVNVLSCPISYNDMPNQMKQAQKLTDWINAKGYEPYGPLILYNSKVTYQDGTGQPNINAKFMIQLKTDRVELDSPFVFERKLCVAGCFLARFEGSLENLQFITNKLMLYVDKHDLRLASELYTLFIAQVEGKLIADVFMTLK